MCSENGEVSSARFEIVTECRTAAQCRKKEQTSRRNGAPPQPNLPTAAGIPEEAAVVRGSPNE